MNRKCKLVDILACGHVAMRETQIPTSDRGFFPWIHRHVYWIQLMEYTKKIYNKLEEHSPAVITMHQRVALNSGMSIEDALKEYKKVHFEKAFHKWKGRMRATLDPETQPHLPCTARRLLYRY